MSEPTSNATDPGETPVGNVAGFTRYFAKDLLSGLLVFLIALPLCLGISLACGYPPIAGIFTAIIGSLVATVLSNSELTIKGPAAGLIVIAIGCVEDFGGDGMAGGWADADMSAYQAALAVGVAAAILQIGFGFFRGGILGEFFPSAAVHGMLAAIGVIIVIKQIPVALGVTAGGEPLEMLREMPNYLAEANPAIAAIGLVSIAIMFVWPWLKERLGPLRFLPAPLVVLLAAVPMGMAFGLMHEHSFTLQGHKYQLGEQYLVSMPDRVFGMFDDITMPDYSALGQFKAWKWVMMFFIIGSLESILSAKAIDLLDPWKRKTNLNRDMVAVGFGNLAAASIGGLPMISEIVRSKANIDNGARTRFADMWHGVFLLLCVALAPMVLHQIPLAALAAMLVYTGYRLAHPSEFLNVYRVGQEQLAIFVATLVAVLATDLLIGIAVGIALKMLIHVVNGVPLSSLFKPYLDVEPIDDQTSRIITHKSAVFSNWILFRKQIEQIGLVQRRSVVLDLSDAQLVDHSVMEKLEELERDFTRDGLTLQVVGLDRLQPYSGAPHAARRKGVGNAERLVVIAASGLAEQYQREFLKLGATACTATPCMTPTTTDMEQGEPVVASGVRLEAVATQEVCELLVEYLRVFASKGEAVSVYRDPITEVSLRAFVNAASYTPSLLKSSH